MKTTRSLQCVLFVLAFLGINPAHALPPKDFTLNYSERIINVDWISSGRVLAYDPGRANDRFFLNVVYEDINGEVWPLLGSTWNIAHMIRDQFPQGISESFARDNLIVALTEFDGVAGLISNANISGYLENISDRPNGGSLRVLMSSLVDMPSIYTSENTWYARFMTGVIGDRLFVNIAYGTLRPFNICRQVRYTLLEGDSSNLDEAMLKKAIDLKYHILKETERKE